MTSLNDLLHCYHHLPASDIALKVNDSINGTHNSLVITAPPGAGKSTLLPLTMLHGAMKNGKILMLEPRRIAAKQIATRMAQMLGETVGKTIGYRVRLESKISPQTRIEVITEGILTRMLIDDATLDGVSIIIFDEFHERNINSDLALALARQTQQIIRPDLKIVIMSATIDAQVICQALEAPLIESKGRIYPVRTIYSQQTPDMDNMAQAVVATIRHAHDAHDGDILVFLPGFADIDKCMKLLANSLSPTTIYPLYGQLASEQQQTVISPSAPGMRKIVLSTPIAETSLTIEGIRIVIDSGLHRTQVFDPRTELSHLETSRISMDMAIQRTGRAGRLANGTCYRMWTTASEHLMAQQRSPEIISADLTSVVLSVAAFGESNIYNLPWLTPPPEASVLKAQHLLVSLGCINKKGHITHLGQKIATMPCHPRIARMILSAKNQNLAKLACDIAAVIEGKDPLTDTIDCDISLRISVLRQHRAQNHLAQWRRIAQIASEYRNMVKADNEDNTNNFSPSDIGLLIAFAYPERIAQATDNIGSFRMANGNNIRLQQSDSLIASQWIAIASLYAETGKCGRVFLAAPVTPSDFDSAIITERDNLSWDNKQGAVVAQHELRVGKLLLKSSPMKQISATDLISVICHAATKYGLSMFNWNDSSVLQLQQRLSKIAEWHPELSLPDISTKHLLSNAHEWLPLYLNNNGRVLTNISELKKIDIRQVIWNIIPYELQQIIDRLAPTHIIVPTGSRIRIDYGRASEHPVLSVRLQECFGMNDTPRIDDKRRPVLMELLSPGYKPVQLTQDLKNFWKTTYFEVRKELRRRYPKHYWPDNPLVAEATKGVKQKH